MIQLARLLYRIEVLFCCCVVLIAARWSKGPLYDAVNDFARKAIRSEVTDNVLSAGIGRANDSPQDRFDLVKTLFNSVDVAFWGSAFVAWTWPDDKSRTA